MSYSSDVSANSGALSSKQVFSLIALGLFAGFMSGMFGVGGGIVIVPGLMMLVGFSQRLASGTSLATIIPLASVGVVSYTINHNVSWVAALLLAAGAMVGARVGTWILARIALKPLQLFFIGFMLLTMVSLFIVVPSRDAVLVLHVWSVVGLVILGVVTGLLSGLLGIGGGLIVVPALMIIFGASDLVAKGTSLLMMIPAAILGTFSNAKNKNVNLRAAAAVGFPACATTFLGSMSAQHISPKLASIFFAIFLGLVALQLLYKTLKPAKADQ